MLRYLTYSTTSSSIEYVLVECEYENIENGYIGTEKRSRPDGSIEEIYKNKMIKDTDGSLLADTRDRYNEYGELLDSLVYIYDEKLVRMDHFSAEKELTHYEVREYDEFGRVIRQMHYRCNNEVDKLSSIIVFEYPGVSKTPSNTYIYSYDSNQKLITVTSWTEEDGETELDASKVEDPADEILDKSADDDGVKIQATDNLTDSGTEKDTHE